MEYKILATSILVFIVVKFVASNVDTDPGIVIKVISLGAYCGSIVAAIISILMIIWGI